MRTNVRKRTTRQFECLEKRELLAGDLINAGLRDAPQDAGAAQAQAPVANIIDGVESATNLPWMVSLQSTFFEDHMCGASLVAPDVVVTVAHCVEFSTADELSAVIGQNDLAQPFEESIRVSEIISHPNYDPLSLDSDVAVLLLSRASTHEPIPLVTNATAHLTDVGKQATVFGWGEDDDGFFPTRLRQATVPIVSNDQANAWLDDEVTEAMIAAGHANGGADTCYGDSGGPMAVTDDDGNFHLAGITSWGESCGGPQSPGVYTRISSFADWISDVGFVTSKGSIRFGAYSAYVSTSATVSLTDSDLAGLESAIVEVRAPSGDSETIELTPTSDAGRFQATLRFQENATFETGNEILEVLDGDILEVVYHDADDGTGAPSDVRASIEMIVDDHADNSRGATPIQVDTAASGELELDGDEDWFSVELESGAFYEFKVTLNGELTESTLDLYDANENQINSADLYSDLGNGGAALSLVTQESGTYYLSMWSYWSTGPYELLVEKSELPHARRVAVPSTTSGQIRNEVFDRFEIELEKGQSYQISTRLLQLPDSVLELYSSTYDLIASNDDYGDGLASSIIFTAPESGIYYVHVDSFDGQDGSYQFIVEQYEPTTITVPSRTTGTLAFDSEDRYQFDAIAGTIYEIEVELGSLFDSTLEIFDQLGQSVGYDDDGGTDYGSKLIFRPTESGKYSIIVGGFGLDGTYVLDVSTVEIQPSVPTAVAIPSSTSTDIRNEFEIDRFTFPVIAGVEYFVSAWLVGLTGASVTVYDENSTVIATDVETLPNGTDRHSFVPSTSGSYFVDVSGEQGDTGSYVFSVGYAEEDDHADTYTDATPLPLRAPESGRIGSPEDQDWFSFEAVQGTVYHITAEPTGLVDPVLALYAPDGRIRLERNDDAHGTLGSQIVWQANTTGTYYLLVDAVTASDVGAYSVNVSIGYGDANLDGVFNSSDLVKLFQRGEFEDSIQGNSNWQDGDWDGDGDFTTRDLVLAFQYGSYEQTMAATKVDAVFDEALEDMFQAGRNDKKNDLQVAAAIL
ncbi:MAG: trypsin-like serine protease [Planctomycetales bacterium]|nr:trypsin-like serine protease [Planctomycetales bacterium]